MRRLTDELQPANVNLNVDVSFMAENFDAEVFSDPSVYTEVIDILCKTLNLKPQAQWWEALRVDFVPRIQYRVPQLHGDTWSKVEAAFADGTAGEVDEFVAAWVLFFDAWMYIHECYASPKESPFNKLAELTRGNDAAALNIAHCIRDLAFGDKSRAADFLRMIQSDDPAYRSIFAAYHLRGALTKKSTRVLRKTTRKAAKKSTKAARKK